MRPHSRRLVQNCRDRLPLQEPIYDSFIGHTGPDAFPHSIVGIGFRGESVSLDAFLPAFHAWQHRCNANIKLLEP